MTLFVLRLHTSKFPSGPKARPLGPFNPPLSDVSPPAACRVEQVIDRDPEFLRYLTRVGIRIGTRLRLQERAPFEGPNTVTVGRKRIMLGAEAARRIFVSVDEDGTDGVNR